VGAAGGAAGWLRAVRAGLGVGLGLGGADAAAAAAAAPALAASDGSCRASARRSWKQSRTPWVKTSGSGTSSRQEVGEMTMRSS
jgi:hypothetical protein